MSKSSYYDEVSAAARRVERTYAVAEELHTTVRMLEDLYDYYMPPRPVGFRDNDGEVQAYIAASDDAFDKALAALKEGDLALLSLAAGLVVPEVDES